MGNRGLAQPNSKALVRLRTLRALTQEQLAHDAGCSLRTVQRAENGELIRRATLHKIAEALECDVAAIDVGGEGSRGVELAGRQRRSRATLGMVGTFVAVLAFSILVDRPRPIRPLAALPLVADVDGNGRDELVLWDPSTGRWYSVDSDGGPLRNPNDLPVLGGDGDVPRSGDLDGDGADELVLWRPRLGEWLALDPGMTEPFIVKDDSGGSLGFLADLDGDGRDDLVTWRSDWRAWSAMKLDGTSLFAGREVGQPGDEPLVGDFDGDGREDLATWRPFSGQWLSQSAEQVPLFEGVEWGQPGDVPVVADFDGDGRVDLAYWRAADGEWAARVAPISASPHRAQVLFRGIRLGRSGDLPLVGDFDGDGRADVSIWRPSDHLWSGLTQQGRSRFDVDTRLVSSQTAFSSRTSGGTWRFEAMARRRSPHRATLRLFFRRLKLSATSGSPPR